MKTACHILLVLLISSSAYTQQYYFRGEVKDESGNPLQNAEILLNRTGYVYRTGGLGTFGIISNQHTDTLTFSFDGYRTEKMVVNADQYVNVKLKLLSVNTTNVRRDKLASLTKDLARDEQRKWFAGDESYASIVENRFVTAKKFPSTGMSLNVDRASYSNIRRFINMNTIVPPDAVRIEEMLNYFNLNYKEPAPQEVFHTETLLTDCPWNRGNQLFYINLFSKKINLDSLAPSNLVFLIDVSGSMDVVNRLPLLKSAFRLLVNNLREKDSVAIVVYGGVTGIMLNTTGGNEKEKILKAIDELTPGGSTPGESGIRMAYSVARNHFIKGGNNRVILATDGDFNVGVKSEEELDELITRHRESGVYLTCLGVGMGNYKDSKIQTLAKKGNGNFAYFDNYREAEKVLLKEFTQTLYTVADDVYMAVEFNPDYVKEYRLIGFDNRIGALKDTLSVIEGGEIGSGHSMMAVFEIEPTEQNSNSSREQAVGGELATIRLQYQLPNDKMQQVRNFRSPFSFTPFAKLEQSYRFSAAVILFGALLKESPYTKDISWSNVVELAEQSFNREDQLQKEFLGLVQQAKNMYTKLKKKKGSLTYR
ncbi:MAG TPA: von Willebrand factor type A domain-containing protein [Chitinophagaceae bacterium]|nr:von Willebrand factor type A domain-containing protein [Chitinophagaceae bacterium]